MRYDKVNPFELGRQHAQEWRDAGMPKLGKSRNPYEQPTGKWCEYNKGYNRTAVPEYFAPKELACA
jgi:hypothetical protein